MEVKDEVKVNIFNTKDLTKEQIRERYIASLSPIQKVKMEIDEYLYNRKCWNDRECKFTYGEYNWTGYENSRYDKHMNNGKCEKEQEYFEGYNTYLNEFDVFE